MRFALTRRSLAACLARSGPMASNHLLSVLATLASHLIPYSLCGELDRPGGRRPILLAVSCYRDPGFSFERLPPASTLSATVTPFARVWVECSGPAVYAFSRAPSGTVPSLRNRH